MNVNIRKLRQAGFKVRVHHTRCTELVSGPQFTPRPVTLSKGGDTRIEVTTPDGQATVVGIARCSLQDSFNRKLGNQIALGRALMEFEENHPQVKTILNTL